jgi:hypothetical protein
MVYGAKLDCGGVLLNTKNLLHGADMPGSPHLVCSGPSPSSYYCWIHSYPPQARHICSVNRERGGCANSFDT